MAMGAKSSVGSFLVGFGVGAFLSLLLYPVIVLATWLFLLVCRGLGRILNFPARHGMPPPENLP